MKHKGYYKRLGVSRLATQKEIRAAYRALMKEYNPLFNWSQEAKQERRELKEAYKILSNQYLRDRYDLGLEIYEAAEKYDDMDDLARTKEFEEFKEAWENLMEGKYGPHQQTTAWDRFVRFIIILTIFSFIAGGAVYLCH